MANDKRFIVKNGLSGPNVRFANGSNTTAYMEMSYAANGTLVIGSNSALGELIRISDTNGNVLTVNGGIAFGTTGISVNSTFYEATANNASFAYGKQESQLSVAFAANATFATSANNALRLNGKQESQLSVANAVFAANASFADTANNSLRLNGKQESQLSVANAVFADTANNALRLNGKQESQLSVANATYATLAGGVAGSFVANSDFSNTANNALYLGGFNSAYYTNADNITSGTLDEARLPYRMNQDVRTTDSVEFKDLVVTGNVYFSGNATLIQTTSIATADSLIYLNEALTATVTNASGNGTYVTYTANNAFKAGYIVAVSGMNPTAYNITYANNITVVSANTTQFTVQSTATGAFVSGGTASAKAAVNPDIGLIAGITVANTYQHTGIIRDATDGVYKVFDSLIAEPDSPFVDIANARIANFQANVVTIASANVGGAIVNSTFYTGTANNASYAYGKQESQLYVANAVFATSANNALRLNGKQESQLSVANAVFADTANNALRLNGKQESQLAVNSAVWATSANNALFAYGKQESQLSVATANNATYAYGKQEGQLSVANSANSAALQGKTWQAPNGIGTVTANTGAFTNLTASGVTTLNANLVLTAGLIANNSAGIAGQVLSSNGTSIYWTNANNISGTVANANNASYLNGKQEGQLSVANAVFADTANNALYAYGKQENQLSVSAANNAAYLQGRTWESPGAIGATVANTGNFSNVTVAIANTTNYLSVRNIAHLSGDSNTTSAIAQVQIASFSANTYGSAKIYIQATETTTTRRHVTELLVVHDNTTAIATEYGMLFTGPTALATYEVDISGNNVRVLATPASANTIAFRVSEQLFTI